MIWYHVRMKKLYLCMTVAAELFIGARADVPFRTGEVFGEAVKVAEGAAGSGRCVNIAGDLLYVGGKETLGVYSLSDDPLRPKFLGEAKDIASTRQIALQDGMAYVTARASTWRGTCVSSAGRRADWSSSTCRVRRDRNSSNA